VVVGAIPVAPEVVCVMAVNSLFRQDEAFNGSVTVTFEIIVTLKSLEHLLSVYVIIADIFDEPTEDVGVKTPVDGFILPALEGVTDHLPATPPV
jgi:hypothetical protein